MNVNELVNALNGPDETDRIYAAQDLGDAGDAHSVSALASRLAVESSRAVKEAIFSALGRIHDDSLIPTVISLVEVDDAFVRNEAVRLLGRRGDEAVPALARAIDSQDPDVRKFALDAVSTIDSGLKNDIYRRLLLDKDINLVITVVEHIGREAKVALKANVEAVLEEAKHPMLISACVDALGQIGDVGSLDAIYRKLGGDNVKEFQAPGLIRAIGHLGCNVQGELLSGLLVRFPEALADTGLDAIEALSRRASMPVASPELLLAIRNLVAKCEDPKTR
jgi:HEAT repeat protein